MTDQTVAELARQLREALNRLEALATRLDNMYVTKEVFESYKNLANEIHQNQRDDIDSLLDDKKWLVRLVGGIIVAALLGVIFVTNGGS